MTIALWVLGIIVAVFMLTVLRGAPYVPTRSMHVEKVFEELYHSAADRRARRHRLG